MIEDFPVPEISIFQRTWVNDENYKLELIEGNDFISAECPNLRYAILPTKSSGIKYMLANSKKDFVVIILSRAGQFLLTLFFKDFSPKNPRRFAHMIANKEEGAR